MMSKRNLACEGRQGTPQRFSRRINVMDSILGNPWDHHLKFTYMECIAYFIFKMGSIKLGHPTPAKFNSSPLKKWWLEGRRSFPIGKVYLQGRTVKLQSQFWWNFFPQSWREGHLKKGTNFKRKRPSVLQSFFKGYLSFLGSNGFCF